VGSVSMEFRSQGLSSILWGVTKLLQYTEGWDLPFSTRESGGGLAVEAGYSYSWGGGGAHSVGHIPGFQQELLEGR
jgi:hypothetical protein